jgi:hypothetical protein
MRFGVIIEDTIVDYMTTRASAEDAMDLLG